MNKMIVLVDYKTNDGRIEGIAMDMGNDLPLIAHQISLMERGSTQKKCSTRRMCLVCMTSNQRNTMCQITCLVSKHVV